MSVQLCAAVCTVACRWVCAVRMRVGMRCAPHGETDPLQHRTAHVCACRRRTEAHEASPSLWVVDGAPLPHEVRQEEQPVTPRRGCTRLSLYGGVRLCVSAFWGGRGAWWGLHARPHTGLRHLQRPLPDAACLVSHLERAPPSARPDSRLPWSSARPRLPGLLWEKAP